MKQTLEYSLDEVPHIAKKLKELLHNCSVLTLTGPLGAGKTTLVKELLKEYGVQDRVTSPTFTYVNLYENSDEERFYHFDLYRIKTLQDFIEAGFPEYLYQRGSLAIIEWPEVILPLLTHAVCHAQIAYHTDPDKRILELEVQEQRHV